MHFLQDAKQAAYKLAKRWNRAFGSREKAAERRSLRSRVTYDFRDVKKGPVLLTVMFSTHTFNSKVIRKKIDAVCHPQDVVVSFRYTSFTFGKSRVNKGGIYFDLNAFCTMMIHPKLYALATRLKDQKGYGDKALASYREFLQNNLTQALCRDRAGANGREFNGYGSDSGEEVDRGPSPGKSSSHDGSQEEQQEEEVVHVTDEEELDDVHQRKRRKKTWTSAIGPENTTVGGGGKKMT